MNSTDFKRMEEAHETGCMYCNHTNSGPCVESVLLAEVSRLHTSLDEERERANANFDVAMLWRSRAEESHTGCEQNTQQGTETHCCTELHDQIIRLEAERTSEQIVKNTYHHDLAFAHQDLDKAHALIATLAVENQQLKYEVANESEGHVNAWIMLGEISAMIDVIPGKAIVPGVQKLVSRLAELETGLEQIVSSMNERLDCDDLREALSALRG